MHIVTLRVSNKDHVIKMHSMCSFCLHLRATSTYKQSVSTFHRHSKRLLAVRVVSLHVMTYNIGNWVKCNSHRLFVRIVSLTISAYHNAPAAAVASLCAVYHTSVHLFRPRRGVFSSNCLR